MAAVAGGPLSGRAAPAPTDHQPLRATDPLCETSPVFEGVPLVAGLAAATYAAWRSYVAARSALLPLIREGDPTRTLIDATRPVYSRSRVRSAARNVAVSLAWLTVAMYGLVPGVGRDGPPGDRGRPAMTATAERVAAVLDRYEAVVGIEIHCQLKTASKMFCGCSTAYDGAPPNTHVLPGLPRPPGGAAGHQPPRGGVRDRDRHRDRGAHP